VVFKRSYYILTNLVHVWQILEHINGGGLVVASINVVNPGPDLAGGGPGAQP